MPLAIDKRAFFEKIGYTPHSEQWLYHSSPARFKVPVCGRRFGKSTMAAKDAEPELFLPNRHYWIAGPNYDLGEKEFRQIWMDVIVKLQLGRDKRVKKSFSKRNGNMFIEFPWHTRLEVRSAEEPSMLVGEGLDGVIVSEAAKHRENTWDQYLRPALADKHGWATFCTTPEGQNWLYQVWQLGRNRKVNPEYESWQFPSWANSIVYPGGETDPEILLLKRTMPNDVFLQEIAASFTAFARKVYTEFDEITHVQHVEFNPAWPNYIAWDWGYVRPLAAIEFQVTPQDQVRVWREHYKAYMTMEQHFEAMRDRQNPTGYRLDNSFGDAADPEAVATVNEKFCPCIAMPEAKENWREGVDLVRTFLKLRETGVELDEFGTPGQEPGLIVDYSCKNTIREFNTYRGKEGTSTLDPTREQPQKKDDHAMDAIRYGIMHLFKLGAYYHLESTFERPTEREILRTIGETAYDDFFVEPSVSHDRGHFSFKGMEF